MITFFSSFFSGIGESGMKQQSRRKLRGFGDMNRKGIEFEMNREKGE